MEDGPPSFPQGFTCPVVLGMLLGLSRISRTGLSPAVAGLSRTVRLDPSLVTPWLLCTGAWRVPRPRMRSACRLVHAPGLGCSPFARRYSGNRGFFLFLEVLRCFSSLRWPPRTYGFSAGIPGHDSRWVSPFGHPRLKACLQLPEAYRSLPRPSSPSDAKASTVCP